MRFRTALSRSAACGPGSSTVRVVPTTGVTNEEEDVALQVEFASVVAVKAAIASTGSGALDLFAARFHNYTQDDHLCRVGFMSTREALDVADELVQGGVNEDNVAVVQSNSELPPWLEDGEVDGQWAIWL